MNGSGIVGSFDMKDIGSVREAFCALIEHENQSMVCGLSIEPGDKTLLLVCDALASDLGVMPRGTIRAINSYVGSDRQVAFGSSYSQGAQVMRDEIIRWSSRFDQVQSRYLRNM